ncbi:hypothetical protein Tsubulata_009299 [Turnera subulata]|uniref:Uncharacterized protein n=1 Tax=Turnera subulata TaxID=218843 RepID=A0A9Q0FGE2_9ROSI|nr:hypothetical protein Tsubulata_009299 [Turnera subulata]
MAVVSSSSQLTCFSSIKRSSKWPLHRRSITLPPLPPPSKLWVVGMSTDGGATQYTSSSSSSSSDTNSPPPPPPPPPSSSPPSAKSVYGTAKIHDFCLGIPYGGVVMGGGLLGFIFSRNPASLASGFLFGAAFLALSISSLNTWRQAKSSLPLVFGQAVLSAALLWKNFQAYSLTKRLVPSGFYIVVSAGMLFFYLHVLMSGGNPPPKKLQSAATVTS